MNKANRTDKGRISGVWYFIQLCIIFFLRSIFIDNILTFLWTLRQTQPPENIDFVQKNDNILFDLYTWLYFIYLHKYSLISLKCMFTGLS